MWVLINNAITSAEYGGEIGRGAFSFDLLPGVDCSLEEFRYPRVATFRGYEIHSYLFKDFALTAGSNLPRFFSLFGTNTKAAKPALSRGRSVRSRVMCIHFKKGFDFLRLPVCVI